MTNIITKVRDLIGDLLITTCQDTFIYYTDKIFTATEPNVSSSTVKVYVNGVLKSTGWSFDATTNKVTYTGTLVANDTVLITYSAYLKYSDNEIRSYIRASFAYIAVEQYKTFIARSDNQVYPSPSEIEENLIALVSSILVRGDIGSYRTPELSINFNEKESKEERIRKAISKFRKAYGVIDFICMDEKAIDIDEDCTEEDNF